MTVSVSMEARLISTFPFSDRLTRLAARDYEGCVQTVYSCNMGDNHLTYQGQIDLFEFYALDGGIRLNASHSAFNQGVSTMLRLIQEKIKK